MSYLGSKPGTGGGGGTGDITAVETPTGAIDGTNNVFNVAHLPLWVVLNGISYYAGDGYTISGFTITLVVTPDPGSTLRSVYQLPA